MIGFCITFNAYADEFGVCHYGKQTLPAVTCYGPTVLNDTIVSGDMNVSGSVQATNIIVNNVTVTGSTTLSKGKVNGSVNVTGNFEAYGIEFLQSLDITGDKILLDHSLVHGTITLHSKAKKPLVIAQCGTTVAGSITFEGTPGTVQVTTDDSMIQSKIVNGTLELVDKSDCAKP